MAIPSGSGTEVLKRTYSRGISNSPIKLLDGVADHIYTVLSVWICNVTANSELIHLYIYPSANSSNITRLFTSVTLPSYQTYMWNDKFVMHGTDELCCQTSDSASLDAICSYIDQDWT